MVFAARRAWTWIYARKALAVALGAALMLESKCAPYPGDNWG